MADDLRTKLIRLAHENKTLRPHLLPLLAQEKQGADRLISVAQEVAGAMTDLDMALNRDKRMSNKTKALMKKFNKAGYDVMEAVMDDTDLEIRM